MDQSYYHLRSGTPSLSGGRMKVAKKGEADGHAAEETEANEDGWSHRSERRGLICSKHLALLLQCTRKAGLCVDSICHMKSCTVCPLALRTLTQCLSRACSSFCSPFRLCFFSLVSFHWYPLLDKVFSFPLTDTPFILILFLSISLWHVARCVHAWLPLIGNALWMSHISPSAQQSLICPSVLSDNES